MFDIFRAFFRNTALHRGVRENELNDGQKMARNIFKMHTFSLINSHKMPFFFVLISLLYNAKCDRDKDKCAQDRQVPDFRKSSWRNKEDLDSRNLKTFSKNWGEKSEYC